MSLQSVTTVENMPNQFERARLKKKYNFKGNQYGKLMERIARENAENIGRAVANSDKRRLARNIKDLIPKGKRGKKFKLPDVSNIIQRSPTIGKAAERGKLLTKTLREKLGKDVKAVMLETGISTTRGTVPKSLSRKVEKKFQETFKEYAERNPKFGMPSQVHTIAVVESRTAANGIRREYMDAVAEQTDRQLFKRWVHNADMSSHPRSNHRAMDGREVKQGRKFKLKGADGRTYFTDGPHSPGLPISEKAGCNCEESFRFAEK